MAAGLKPPGFLVLRDHPLARTLAHFYPLSEGHGLPHNAMRAITAAPSGAPTWIYDAYGAARHYVAGSSQYDDIGAVPEINGAANLTLTYLARRSTAGSDCQLMRASATSNEFGLNLSGDGKIYCLVGNGSDAWVNFTMAGTAWHMVTMRYEGGAGASARARCFVDGAELTAAGTFGTIPTTAPTNTVGMRLGSDQGRTAFSSGDIAAVWLHTAALDPSHIAALHRDPFAMSRPVEPRRSMVALGRVGLLFSTPPPQTITFTDEEPLGSPTAERDDVIQTLAAPTTADNISTLTATVDGVAATVSVASVAPNSKRGTITQRFQFGHTYTVVWNATTILGYTNLHTQVFTVREPDTGIGERVDLLIPVKASAGERVELIVPPRTSATPERVELVVISTGAVGFDTVAVQVIEGLPVGYFTPERVALDVASLVDMGDLFRLSLAAGTGYDVGLALTEQVEGMPDIQLSRSLDSIAAGREAALALSLDTGTARDEQVPLSEEVGRGGDTAMALSVDDDTPALEPLEGEAESRSAARSDEEQL